MDISVIIPTRNRCRHLMELLTSLSSQSLDASRFEVIVVDNGSSDETPCAVPVLQGTTAFRLLYLREEAPGLHNARHAGMLVAATDILVFADDDIIPFDSWLEGVLEAFSRTGALLVGGRNLPLWEIPPPRWLEKMWYGQEGNRILGHLSIIDLGDRRREIDACLVWGCNFSVRKSLLQETRGFHPDAMPEELIHLRGDGESYISDYLVAKGCKAQYHPKASVHHRVPKERMTFEYFRKRSFNQGISDSYARLRKSAGAAVTVGTARFAPTAAARFLTEVMTFLELRRFESDSKRLSREIAAGYGEGYRYHQELFTSDQEIRDWVLQTDYLMRNDAVITTRPKIGVRPA